MLTVCVCLFIPDGLFGQCRTSKQDLVQYQVSVPILKRMQEVLKQLMLQGEIIHGNHHQHFSIKLKLLELLPYSFKVTGESSKV